MWKFVSFLLKFQNDVVAFFKWETSLMSCMITVQLFNRNNTHVHETILWEFHMAAEVLSLCTMDSNTAVLFCKDGTLIFFWCTIWQALSKARCESGSLWQSKKWMRSFISKKHWPPESMAKHWDVVQKLQGKNHGNPKI